MFTSIARVLTVASRFSDMPELSVRGLHNVSETYADTAKVMLLSLWLV